MTTTTAILDELAEILTGAQDDRKRVDDTFTALRRRVEGGDAGRGGAQELMALRHSLADAQECLAELRDQLGSKA